MTTSHWKGKNALVCGATAGLGREIVEQLAKADVANLGIVARSAEPLQQLAEQLQSRFPRCKVHAISADMGRSESVADLQEQLTQFAGIDLVLNAIGQSDRGTIASLSMTKLSELYEANVVSSLHTIQAARASLEQRQGCMVLIGSLASFFAPRFLGGYALAKHSVAALAQQARLELQEDGIHVMLACPGPIRRADAGTRYQEQQESDLPDSAMQPGGGAKISGLDPQKLARDILIAAARKQKTLVRPRKARLLIGLNAIFPSLAESILKNRTS
ncbi:MAG: SDR family NAD(P)-dependent oxidoreductase [Planctomycetota bacterium]